MAGDGTTSVTVICGALLKKCSELLERGIHPTVISDAFALAAEKAVEILDRMSIPVDLQDRDALIKAANTWVVWVASTPLLCIQVGGHIKTGWHRPY